MKASEIFNPGWMTPGLPGLRPIARARTYELADYNSLPPVPQTNPDLAWLTPLHPELERRIGKHGPGGGDRKTYTESRTHIITEAKAHNLTLPDAFILLTGSFELQDRIPSCTGCYFDLPEKIIESPFRSGDYIIRFLNDSQNVVCWYLYLPADDSPFVISSSGDGEEMFLDSIDFAEHPASVDNAKRYAALAAKSFDEFIYRFWIENCLWFHMYGKLPLTSRQLQYAQSIDPGFKDPNAA